MGTLTVNSTTTISSTAYHYCASLSSGTIKAYGDVTLLGNCHFDPTIRILGNASGQKITTDAGTNFSNLELAAGSNTITFVGSTTIANGSFTYTSGTIAGPGPLIFSGGGAMSITPGAILYPFDVCFSLGCDGGTVNFKGGKMECLGNM